MGGCVCISETWSAPLEVVSVPGAVVDDGAFTMGVSPPSFSSNVLPLRRCGLRCQGKNVHVVLLATLLSAGAPVWVSCAGSADGHKGDWLAVDDDLEEDPGGGAAALQARDRGRGARQQAERGHSLAEDTLADEPGEQSDGDNLMLFKASADATLEMKAAAEKVRGMAKDISKAAHESTQELAGYHSAVLKMGEHFNKVEEKAKAMHKQVQREYSDVEKARMCAFDVISGVRGEPCPGIRLSNKAEEGFGQGTKNTNKMAVTAFWLNRKVRVTRGDLMGDVGVVKNVSTGSPGMFSVLIHGMLKNIKQTYLELIESGDLEGEAGEGAGEGAGEDAGEGADKGVGEGAGEGAVEGAGSEGQEGEGDSEAGEERYGSLPIKDVREGVRVKVNGGPYGGQEGTIIRFDNASGTWVAQLDNTSDTVIVDEGELIVTHGFAEGVGVITEDNELGILQNFDKEAMMWKVKLKDTSEIVEYEAEDLLLWQPDWENMQPRLLGKNLFLKENDPFHQPDILKSVDYMKTHQDEDYTPNGDANEKDSSGDGEDAVAEPDIQKSVDYMETHQDEDYTPNGDANEKESSGDGEDAVAEATSNNEVEEDKVDDSFIQEDRLRFESENPHEFGSHLTFAIPSEHKPRLQDVIDRDRDTAVKTIS